MSKRYSDHGRLPTGRPVDEVERLYRLMWDTATLQIMANYPFVESHVLKLPLQHLSTWRLICHLRALDMTDATV